MQLSSPFLASWSQLLSLVVKAYRCLVVLADVMESTATLCLTAPYAMVVAAAPEHMREIVSIADGIVKLIYRKRISVMNGATWLP